MMTKTKGKIMKSTKGTKMENNGLEMMCKHPQGLNHNIKPHFNSRPTATNGFVVSTTICHCKHVGPKTPPQGYSM